MTALAFGKMDDQLRISGSCLSLCRFFCVLRVKDKYTLLKALSVDPIYLQYRQMEKAIDYRVSSFSIFCQFQIRSAKLEVFLSRTGASR